MQKAETIRNILIDNMRQRQAPSNIKELTEASGVAHNTIKKMYNGDFSGVKWTSIEKVYTSLGYNIALCAEDK